MISLDTALQPVLLKGDFDPPSWWTRIAALNVEFSLSQVKLVKPSPNVPHILVHSKSTFMADSKGDTVCHYSLYGDSGSEFKLSMGQSWVHKTCFGNCSRYPGTAKTHSRKKAATIHYKQCSTALGTFYWQCPIVAGTFRSNQLGWRLKRARKLPLMPLFPSGGDP